MPRRKTGRRRGRPRNPNARRRSTTRAGRRGEVDLGTAELRAHRVAMTGMGELPNDPLGVLLGRGLIEQEHYLAGRDLADLLELAARRLMVGNGSAAASWLAILGVRGAPGATELDSAAEWARRILDRIERQVHPEVLALTVAVAEGRWLPFMLLVLRGRVPVRSIARVRLGLNQVARCWSRGTKLLDGEAARTVTVHV